MITVVHASQNLPCRPLAGSLFYRNMRVIMELIFLVPPEHVPNNRRKFAHYCDSCCLCTTPRFQFFVPLFHVFVFSCNMNHGKIQNLSCRRTADFRNAADTLFSGTAGVPGVPTNELSNVSEVTVTLDAAEADVTTRANSGFRATVSGLKECDIEWTMMYKPGDAGLKAVKDAWSTGDPLKLAALTSEKGEGPVGDFSITGFSRSEPLEEAITYDVTAKLTEWEKWQEETVEEA